MRPLLNPMGAISITRFIKVNYGDSVGIQLTGVEFLMLIGMLIFIGYL